MPDLFLKGIARIAYKARNFATGKTVTAYIWSPSLNKSPLLTFSEVESGLYYLNYDFTEEGVYFAIFYEDGEATTMGAFRVIDLPTAFRTSVVSPSDPSNSVGKLLLDTKGLVAQIYKIETGRWRIAGNQLILYDEDGVTPMYVFDLKDKTGLPTEESPYERSPT